MSVYQFKVETVLKGSLDEVWSFISSPENLKIITPDYLGFEILSTNLPSEMYQGMIIRYKVSPLLGLKLTWVSEISQVKEKEFFVDQQLVGPYKLWHHQHILKETKDGILMTDIVTYQPPFAMFSSILNHFIIRKKLKEIFDYRSEAMDKIFNKA